MADKKSPTKQDTPAEEATRDGASPGAAPVEEPGPQDHSKPNGDTQEATGAEAPAQPGQDDGAFFPVPLHTLPPDAEQNLRLYLYLADSDQYIPYGDENFALGAKHKEELEQRGIKYVYVAAADKRPYLRHMEDHLGELIAEGAQLTPDMQANVVYECISQLTESVLEAPQANADLERVTAGARALAQFILARPENFTGLLHRMASTYQLPSHASNACILGLGLGMRLGLSEEELTRLGTGLLLMDLGKAEIDRAILEKQCTLSDEEWEIMRRHPGRGAEILVQIGDPDPAVLAVVQQHHERCSGSGYPAGLKSPEIHFFAKIAGLVDVFDALTTQRAYRQALESFPAVRVMQSEMREDFNPLLFRELILLLGASAKAARRFSGADGALRKTGRRVA